MFRAHVMEKILLSVACVRAEVGSRKLMETLHAHASAGKIKLLKSFHDPDVDRESRLDTVSEQQYAVGDFSADPRQLHQLSAS